MTDGALDQQRVIRLADQPGGVPAGGRVGVQRRGILAIAAWIGITCGRPGAWVELGDRETGVTCRALAGLTGLLWLGLQSRAAAEAAKQYVGCGPPEPAAQLCPR